MMVSMTNESFMLYQERIWKNPPRGNKRKLSEKYFFHQFHGKRCFVIAGGPSLYNFNWKLLDGEFTIGVNRIGLVFQPDIVYIADSKLLPETRARHTKSCIVIADYENGVFNNCYYVRTAGQCGIPGEIDKIYTGDNSAFGALNLAMALGFNPIYLLGFDFKYSHGMHHLCATWGNPRQNYETDYLPRFRKEFERLSEYTKDTDYKIINLNPGSELKSFPFSTIEKVI